MSTDGTQHSEEKTPLQAASERFNAAMARDDFEAASRHLQDMIAARNAVSVERAAGEDDAEITTPQGVARPPGYRADFDGEKP